MVKRTGPQQRSRRCLPVHGENLEQRGGLAERQGLLPRGQDQVALWLVRYRLSDGEEANIKRGILNP